jgi:hypothetical protein
MIAATTRALIRAFRSIEPNTHLAQRSIVELETLPAVVLTGPLLQEVLRRRRDAERITAVDLEAGHAVREKPPRWYNMRFNVAFSAESNIDLLETIAKCSKLPQRVPLLRAEGAERIREYSWRWSAFPSASTAPNVSEVCEGRGELTVEDVEVYSDIRELVPLIRVVELDLPGETLHVRKED